MTSFFTSFTSLLKCDLIKEDLMTILKKINLPSFSVSYYFALFFFLAFNTTWHKNMFIVDLLLLECMFDKSSLFTTVSEI